MKSKKPPQIILFRYLSYIRSPHLTRQQRWMFIELTITEVLVYLFRIYVIVMFSIMLLR